MLRPRLWFCVTAAAVLGCGAVSGAPSSAAAPGIATTTAVTCDGDGVSGNRVQLIRIDTSVSGPISDPYTQGIATQIDAAFLASAEQTGGVRHVRFVHDSACVAVVLGVPVSARGRSSFTALRRELKAAGFDRPDRDYLVFGLDAGCGFSDWENDDTPSPSNRANRGPHYSAVGVGCYSAQYATHELVHALGAVNDSAPHATGGGHCWDEADVMCYKDSNKVVLVQLCPAANATLLDCDHDDYFHTDPPPQSYLATHWNVADSGFLIGAGQP